MSIKRFVALVIIISSQLLPNRASGEELFGIQEIPYPTLNDIAIASFDSFGNPVIYYNPNVVANVPQALADFIRAHEYAHHKLNHVRQQMFQQNPYSRVELAKRGEVEADRWATQYWMENDPDVVWGAVRAFRDPRYGNYGDLTHLPTAIRANLIESHAQTVSGGTRTQRPRRQAIPCDHPLHPNGDITPCSHGTLHFRGDVVPCTHTVFTQWGPRPAHPMGDLIPCSHPIHPRGDISPCNHVAHPGGH